MHIAINCLLVSPPFTGVQHSIIRMTRAMLEAASAHRFTLVTLEDVDIAAHLGPVVKPYGVVRAPVRGGERFRRIFWEQTQLAGVLEGDEVDVLFAPGYLTSLLWPGPSVVFIHDTIALSHPHLTKWANALNYRLLLPPSARKATLVATPSQASARDVARYCRVPLEKTRVAPLGVEMPRTPTPEQVADVRQAVGVGEAPYLLAVSAIEPKKNFDSLIRWFTAWRAAGLPHQLVIAGGWGWKTGAVRRALADSPCRADIHLPGYVPQADLPALMAGADLLLMPSRYEGFGMPVLEAMALGTPVVTSDRGALPETVGDAGLILPLDDARWQADIPALLADPARLRALRAAGPPWAAAHPWSKTGERLLQVLEEAVNLSIT